MDDITVINGMLFHNELAFFEGDTLMEDYVYGHNNQKLLKYLANNYRVVNKVVLSLEKITSNKNDIIIALSELLDLKIRGQNITNIAKAILETLSLYFGKDFAYVTDMEDPENYELMLNNYSTKIFLDEIVVTDLGILLVLGIFR